MKKINKDNFKKTLSAFATGITVVATKHTRQRIGYKLLKELLDVSKNNKNIKLIIAVIGSIDSKGSLKLHEKLGFKKTGVLKKVGFKNNKWIDAIFLQKKL